MKGIVSENSTIRRMPAGRVVFSVTEMRDEAARRGHHDVVAWLDETIKAAHRVLRTEFSYNQTRDRQSTARGKAVALDHELDALIAAMESIVQARTTGPPDDPVVKAAKKVKGAVFPRGVAKITQQSHELQLGTMIVMDEHFYGDLATEVELLGIQREVDLMHGLLQAFQQELRVVKSTVTTYDQVTQAREELHEYVCMAVILIIAAYPALDEESTRARESLLAPFRDQQERVLNDHRRRRRPLDVDPATGVVLFTEPTLDDDDVLDPQDVDVLVTDV
ncbi:MAG: hypothetical protein ACNA8W_09345 [Bradymonadaceae bacterium]